MTYLYQRIKSVRIFVRSATPPPTGLPAAMALDHAWGGNFPRGTAHAAYIQARTLRAARLCG